MKDKPKNTTKYIFEHPCGYCLVDQVGMISFDNDNLQNLNFPTSESFYYIK